MWLTLITLVWILIGNSISLSVGGIEDLRAHRGIRTIVLIVAVAINLVKLNMSVTQEHCAMDPIKHTVQFAFVSNVVKVSLKYPVCAAIANLLPGMDSEQLLEKISTPKQHLFSPFPGQAIAEAGPGSSGRATAALPASPLCPHANSSSLGSSEVPVLP